jgi:hypothetical protein
MTRRSTVIVSIAAAIAGVASAACAPGYMKPDQLEAREQGPRHCAMRCHEFGMRMGALVMVSDRLPGCVCVPHDQRAASDAGQGASGAATGYVVIAAAAAAQQQQYQQQQQVGSPRR